MSLDVAVIVATFGDPTWKDLAHARAVPSVVAQTLYPAQLVVHHGDTLADARNRAAEQADTEWLCFLDADDELDPGYLEAMATAGGDLRAPAVQYIHHGREDPPVSLADRDISRLNPCVIGTLVRSAMFRAVGGFDRRWPIYEDWALFLACWTHGAELVHVPRAVYRAHVTDGSRNNQSRAIAERTYHAIRRHHLRPRRTP